MQVQIRVVGQTKRYDDIHTEMDAIPREGDVVNVPGISQGESVVRTVAWYPVPDPEEGVSEPFVYIVLGSPRR